MKPRPEDVPGPAPTWPCRHQGRPGTYDESVRRASHEELAVAHALVAEGHHVRTVAERTGARSPDLFACGVAVEVKSFLSLDDRQGRAPSAKSVANKLLDARGQGDVAVVWGRGSGLTEATARAGYRFFCEKALEGGLGRLKAARIIGNGFDISFRPQAEIRLARSEAARRPTRPAAAKPMGA